MRGGTPTTNDPPVRDAGDFGLSGCSIEGVRRAALYSRANALTREQYALPSIFSEPGGCKPVIGRRGTRLLSSRGKPAGVASDNSAHEWTDRGVVAQLGEHLHGMQGVGGSSPPSSTTSIGQVKVVPRREPPSS